MKYILITFLFTTSISLSQWQDAITGNTTIHTRHQ